MAITVQKIIELVDELEPNQYGDELKMSWLSELDAKVFRTVISRRENPVIESFTEYTSPDDELLILFPDGQPIYSWWLQMKIAAENAEWKRYNSLSALFNEAYGDWEREYVRTHRSIETPQTARFWF